MSFRSLAGLDPGGRGRGREKENEKEIGRGRVELAAGRNFRVLLFLTAQATEERSQRFLSYLPQGRDSPVALGS